MPRSLLDDMDAAGEQPANTSLLADMDVAGEQPDPIADYSAGASASDDDMRADLKRRVVAREVELADLRKRYRDAAALTSPQIPQVYEERGATAEGAITGGTAAPVGNYPLSDEAKAINAEILNKELAIDQARMALDQNDPNQLRSAWQGLTTMVQRPSQARRILPAVVGGVLLGSPGAIAGTLVAGAAYARDAAYIKQAAEKVAAGKPVDDDEETALLGRTLAQSRSPNVGYLTTSLISNIAPYAVGFAARNAVAGKPFVNALRSTKVGQAWVGLESKSKMLSFVGKLGDAFTAGGAMALIDPNSVGMVIERMTPVLALSESPDGQDVALKLAKMGEPMLKAIGKVGGLNWLEHSTESFSDLSGPLGDALYNLGKKVAPAGSKGVQRTAGAMIRGMAGLLLHKYGTKTRVTRLLSGGKIGGVLDEAGEEFWNAVGAEALGEKGSLDGWLSTLPAQILGFGVYGGAGTLSSMRATARAENAIRGVATLTGATGVTVEEKQVEPSLTPDGIKHKAHSDIVELEAHNGPDGRGLTDKEAEKLETLKSLADNVDGLSQHYGIPVSEDAKPEKRYFVTLTGADGRPVVAPNGKPVSQWFRNKEDANDFAETATNVIKDQMAWDKEQAKQAPAPEAAELEVKTKAKVEEPAAKTEPQGTAAGQPAAGLPGKVETAKTEQVVAPQGQPGDAPADLLAERVAKKRQQRTASQPTGQPAPAPEDAEAAKLKLIPYGNEPPKTEPATTTETTSPPADVSAPKVEPKPETPVITNPPAEGEGKQAKIPAEPLDVVAGRIGVPPEMVALIRDEMKAGDYTWDGFLRTGVASDLARYDVVEAMGKMRREVLRPQIEVIDREMAGITARVAKDFDAASPDGKVVWKTPEQRKASKWLAKLAETADRLMKPPAEIADQVTTGDAEYDAQMAAKYATPAAEGATGTPPSSPTQSPTPPAAGKAAADLLPKDVHAALIRSGGNVFQALAGDRMASVRQAAMEKLTGQKVPKSKAGVTRLHEELKKAAGVGPGTLDEQEKAILAWLEGKSAAVPPPPSVSGVEPIRSATVREAKTASGATVQYRYVAGDVRDFVPSQTTDLRGDNERAQRQQGLFDQQLTPPQAVEPERVADLLSPEAQEAGFKLAQFFRDHGVHSALSHVDGDGHKWNILNDDDFTFLIEQAGINRKELEHAREIARRGGSPHYGAKASGRVAVGPDGRRSIHVTTFNGATEGDIAHEYCELAAEGGFADPRGLSAHEFGEWGRDRIRAVGLDQLLAELALKENGPPAAKPGERFAAKSFDDMSDAEVDAMLHGTPEQRAELERMMDEDEGKPPAAEPSTARTSEMRPTVSSRVAEPPDEPWTLFGGKQEPIKEFDTKVGRESETEIKRVVSATVDILKKGGPPLSAEREDVGGMTRGLRNIKHGAVYSVHNLSSLVDWIAGEKSSFARSMNEWNSQAQRETFRWHRWVADLYYRSMGLEPTDSSPLKMRKVEGEFLRQLQRPVTIPTVGQAVATHTGTGERLREVKLTADQQFSFIYNMRDAETRAEWMSLAHDGKLAFTLPGYTSPIAMNWEALKAVAEPRDAGSVSVTMMKMADGIQGMREPLVDEAVKAGDMDLVNRLGVTVKATVPPTVSIVPGRFHWPRFRDMVHAQVGREELAGMIEAVEKAGMSPFDASDFSRDLRWTVAGQARMKPRVPGAELPFVIRGALHDFRAMGTQTAEYIGKRIPAEKMKLTATNNDLVTAVETYVPHGKTALGDLYSLVSFMEHPRQRPASPVTEEFNKALRRATPAVITYKAAVDLMQTVSFWNAFGVMDNMERAEAVKVLGRPFSRAIFQPDKYMARFWGYNAALHQRWHGYGVNPAQVASSVELPSTIQRASRGVRSVIDGVGFLLREGGGEPMRLFDEETIVAITRAVEKAEWKKAGAGADAKDVRRRIADRVMDIVNRTQLSSDEYSAALLALQGKREPVAKTLAMFMSEQLKAAGRMAADERSQQLGQITKKERAIRAYFFAVNNAIWVNVFRWGMRFLLAGIGALLAGKSPAQARREWRARRPGWWLAYMTFAQMATSRIPVVGQPLSLLLERALVRPVLKMPSGQIGAFDTPVDAAVAGLYRGSERMGRGAVKVLGAKDDSREVEDGMRSINGGALDVAIALSLFTGQGLLPGVMSQYREMKAGYDQNKAGYTEEEWKEIQLEKERERRYNRGE